MPAGLDPLHVRAALVARRRGVGEEIRSGHGVITPLAPGSPAGGLWSIVAGAPAGTRVVMSTSCAGGAAVRARAPVQSDMVSPLRELCINCDNCARGAPWRPARMTQIRLH